MGKHENEHSLICTCGIELLVFVFVFLCQDLLDIINLGNFSQSYDLLNNVPYAGRVAVRMSFTVQSLRDDLPVFSFYVYFLV